MFLYSNSLYSNVGSLRFRNVGRQGNLRETLGPRVQGIPGFFLTNPLSGKLVLFRRSVQWKREPSGIGGTEGVWGGMASNPAHRLPFLSDVKKTTLPVPQGSSAFHSSICASLLQLLYCQSTSSTSARPRPRARPAHRREISCVGHICMLLLGYNQCCRESMGFPVQEVASVTALRLCCPLCMAKGPSMLLPLRLYAAAPSPYIRGSISYALLDPGCALPRAAAAGVHVLCTMACQQQQ
jgi:hypothetical protein